MRYFLLLLSGLDDSVDDTGSISLFSRNFEEKGRRKGADIGLLMFEGWTKWIERWIIP